MGWVWVGLRGSGWVRAMSWGARARAWAWVELGSGLGLGWAKARAWVVLRCGRLGWAWG